MGPARGAPTGDRARLRVLIVADHGLMREGLQSLIAQAAPGWSTLAFGSGPGALEALGHERFDVAVIGLAMPGIGGLDLIKRLHADHPGMAVLVLGMQEPDPYALRALRAGAKGYLPPSGTGRELVDAVAKVAAGGAYITPGLVERLVLQLQGGWAGARHGQLSDRELEVLRRLVAGQQLGAIAQDLQLSVKTVSSHKGRILFKLGLPNLAALVRYGLQQGLGDETAGGPAALGAD